jgi:hypothetical protein
VWSKSDSRTDTLHNRHHRQDREMSGDPGTFPFLRLPFLVGLRPLPPGD